jgi:hypothetical protein
MPESFDDLPFDPRRRPDSDFKAPDLVGAVEGWRCWAVPTELPPFGVAPKVYSVTWSNFYWTPKQTSAAVCEFGCPAEDVPGESCGCGFYSAKTREHLLSMAYHIYDAEETGRYRIMGRIANWGKVIEGSQGWRSQYSYPIEFFVPFEAWRLAKPLAESYGVKVKLDNILAPASAIL